MRTRFLLGATIGLACLASQGVSAASMAIDPKCSKMKDKIGCTCAVQNGGEVHLNNNTWTYPRRAVDAFAQCKIGNK